MGGEKNRAPDSFKLWQPPHTEDEKNQLALWSNKTDIHSNMRHLRGDHMPCNNLVLRWENLREQTYCIFFFFFFLASNEGGEKKKKTYDSRGIQQPRETEGNEIQINVHVKRE